MDPEVDPGVDAGVDAGDRLLTVREVAAVMRVSTMTVYRLIKAGALHAIRVGRSFRIRRSDLNRFFEAGAVTASLAAGAPGSSEAEGS